MQRNSTKTVCLILSRQNFGEADRIITIFSRDLGKLRIKATGVRKITSHRAPHLELFNETELLLYRGGGMPTVSEAKIIENFKNIKENLEISAYVFYLMEIIDKLLPEDQPNAAIFEGMIEILGRLNQMSDKHQALRLVKQFILNLLVDLGYLAPGQVPETSLTEYIESVAEKRIRSKKFIDEI